MPILGKKNIEFYGIAPPNSWKNNQLRNGTEDKTCFSRRRGEHGYEARYSKSMETPGVLRRESLGRIGCACHLPNFNDRAELLKLQNAINIDQSQTRIGVEDRNMSPIDRLVPKLRKAPQPPLTHAGAIPDSNRAKRPLLDQPPGPDPELTPGDRVEGLGNFGKPTDEFGTVERANEDDAVVKWDDDGRTRVHQAWLKKA